jgi:hypothetical protein
VAAVRGKRGQGRHQVRRRQPYGWLGAGAVTLGLGAALASGSGVAHADSASGELIRPGVSGEFFRWEG